MREMRLAVMKMSKGMKFRFFTMDEWREGRARRCWLVPLSCSICTIRIFTLSLPNPLSRVPLSLEHVSAVLLLNVSVLLCSCLELCRDK